MKHRRTGPQPMRVRWIRHRTPEAIVAAFFRGIGFKNIREVGADGGLDGEGTLRAVRAHRMWAFCETKARPVRVHFWQDGRRTLIDLALMLGHELGHASGRPARGMRVEEDRADGYGVVAATVLRKLLRGIRQPVVKRGQRR